MKSFDILLPISKRSNFDFNHVCSDEPVVIAARRYLADDVRVGPV